jgi:hypothetical protein
MRWRFVGEKRGWLPWSRCSDSLSHPRSIHRCGSLGATGSDRKACSDGLVARNGPPIQAPAGRLLHTGTPAEDQRPRNRRASSAAR